MCMTEFPREYEQLEKYKETEIIEIIIDQHSGKQRDLAFVIFDDHNFVDKTTIQIPCFEVVLKTGGGSGGSFSGSHGGDGYGCNGDGYTGFEALATMMIEFNTMPNHKTKVVMVVPAAAAVAMTVAEVLINF
ncbi:hypothetical protein J0S82_018474 [Galemys pyrenaicus]|uniref:Uncharacterized protein n=1 Tax=Galemys pyrenaicus TaxID=202257 RepID=A0A8J6DJY3_GALPY|nr:hypothetical protein J0S82_018474 [Galemys pyrenaicus]